MVLYKAVVDVFEHRTRKQVLQMVTEQTDIDPAAGILTQRDFSYHGVAVSELALEMLRTAEAFELSVDHDGNASAQCITLFHAVGTSQNHQNTSIVVK